MKYVTVKELAQILFDFKVIKGMPLFASVLQFTTANLVKKSRTNKDEKNPYPDTMKLSKVSILLNSDYVTAVENQLEKENKDESEYKKGKNTMPITFGQNNQFIGLFNGEFVLQYRPNDNIKPHVKYVNEGKVIDKKKIEQYLPKVSHAQNQGTDREIFWRKLYLTNLRKITLNGETYKVIH